MRTTYSYDRRIAHVALSPELAQEIDRHTRVQVRRLKPIQDMHLEAWTDGTYLVIVGATPSQERSFIDSFGADEEAELEYRGNGFTVYGEIAPNRFVSYGFPEMADPKNWKSHTQFYQDLARQQRYAGK